MKDSYEYGREVGETLTDEEFEMCAESIVEEHMNVHSWLDRDAFYDGICDGIPHEDI